MTTLDPTLLTLEEVAAAPVTPAADHGVLYYRDTKVWWIKDENGREYPIGALDLRSRSGETVLCPQVLRVPRGTIERLSAGVARLHVQPRPTYRQVAWGIANGTTVDGAGLTLTGTVGNSPEIDSQYSSFTSAAAGGAQAGVRDTTPAIRRTHNLTWTCLMRTDAAITGTRFFVGLMSTTPANQDNQGTAGIQGIFFRATPAGNWIACCANGTNQTETNTGIAVATDTVYLFRIRYVEADAIAYFSVNGGAEVQVNATLPGSSTALGTVCHVITGAAASRIINYSRHLLEYGNVA